MDISTRTAYRLKAVYKKYVLDLGLEPLSLVASGYTKLSMIAEQVDSDNAAEWLAKAETLSRSDIIRELKDNDVNYQEPTIVKLLDSMHLSYFNSGTDVDATMLLLSEVKLVQQGKLVTLTGRLAQNDKM